MSSSKIFIVVVLVLLSAAIFFNKERNCPICPANAPAEPTTAPVPVAPETEPASAYVPAALPRLIEIGSMQCRPCQMMEPVLAELRSKYIDLLTVEFIDVRVREDAVAEYKIRVIPTQIFLDAHGKEVFRHEGFFALEGIVAKWSELGVSLE